VLRSLLPKLRCPACYQGLSEHVFADGALGHIRDGVLTCASCGAWYPIEDDVLSLVVPELRDADSYKSFCSRRRREIRALGLPLDPEAGAADPDAYAGQLRQREHFDWFAENRDLTYADYSMQPVWRAADRLAFSRWRSALAPGSWLLDVGCANGRSAFQMLREDIIVVGLDISEKMVRQSMRLARTRNVQGRVSFLVADGNDLPFQDECFDGVLTYGVLHHLPRPGRTCRDIHRVLKSGGVHLASENHTSFLRPIFDWMMKAAPLWTEEAGQEPLISKAMLERWHSGLPVSLKARYSVFLPPHLFNLLGARIAYYVMRLTDAIAASIPGLRKAGGLILHEARKTATPGNRQTSALP